MAEYGQRAACGINGKPPTDTIQYGLPDEDQPK